MTSITERKAWYDKCFITIDVKDGESAQVRSKTTSLEISGGGYDKEGIATHGGVINRFGRRQDWEISFDGIMTSHQDFDWIDHGVSSSATTITSSEIKDCRVTFLWTDATCVTTATMAVPSASEAYRESYADLTLVDKGKVFNAGEHLQINGITFRGSFEDADGNMNFRPTLAGTGSALSALGSYAGSNKF